MMKFICLFITSFLITFSALSQSKFVIENGNKRFKLSFEEVNNLIIIPVELNGVVQSFLLDTGVKTAIVFKLPGDESLELERSGKILLKGLGSEKPIEGFKSKGNTIKIGKAVNRNITLHVVPEVDIGLSNRMGVPIHGIIGNDLFKDFVLDINYQRKKLKVFNFKYYKPKKCRSCEDFKIQFYKDKPYITLMAEFSEEVSKEVTLLIDSGSSEALWLFQDTKKGIELPENKFSDFLGLSLNGSIYGYRSRIKNLKLGQYQLENITTSFPDSLHTKDLKLFKKRDGNLGGQFLNRFRVVFNYKDKTIRLKPNSSFNDPFNYDMSGLAVAHQGFELIEKRSLKLHTYYDLEEHGPEPHFSLEPKYVIVEIRSDSPAEEAGFKVGDVIKKISGKPAYKFSLEQIINLLASEQGKKIKMKIERDGTEMAVDFNLVNKL